jgi:hypothetical protein
MTPQFSCTALVTHLWILSLFDMADRGTVALDVNVVRHAMNPVSNHIPI